MAATPIHRAPMRPRDCESGAASHGVERGLVGIGDAVALDAAQFAALSAASLREIEARFV